MANPYWPLFDLRVATPRLEIRLPTDDELYRLLVVTDAGIHDPDTMPFSIPWTDVEPPRRHRESLKWWWSQRARWQPENWSLTGAVFVDGEPVGVQDLGATDFAYVSRGVERVVAGAGAPGQGDRQGDAAPPILHLAFEGLGALEAHTGAFADNAPSLGVTRALGYSENGHEVVLRRGQPARAVQFCLDRQSWSANRRSDITISGLEGCREMFGLDP